MTIGSIAIVGDGWEAWLAAALLHRMTGGSHALTVAGAGGNADTPMPVLPTTPEASVAHRLLGLDEAVRAMAAVPRLGTRVEGATPVFLPLIPFGLGEARRPFAQQWLRLRRRGAAGPLSHYSPAEALAGRAGPRDPRIEAEGGLFLEPGRYRTLLRDHALRVGVRHRVADAVAAERDEAGHVVSLRLADGGELRADWFVDASGGEGGLVERLLGGAWRDDPAATFVVTSERQEVDGGEPRSGRVAALPTGWRWTLPLPGALATGTLWRDGAGATWRGGVLADAWCGNAVAIGSAQRRLHPLEPLSAERVQRAIARFVTLFPRRETLPAVAREYRRQLDQDDAACVLASRAIDLLGGQGSSSAGLDAIGRDYRRLGRLPALDGDPMPQSWWLALLDAICPLPVRHDPSADRVPVDQAAAMLQRSAAAVRAL